MRCRLHVCAASMVPSADTARGGAAAGAQQGTSAARLLAGGVSRAAASFRTPHWPCRRSRSASNLASAAKGGPAARALPGAGAAWGGGAAGPGPARGPDAREAPGAEPGAAAGAAGPAAAGAAGAAGADRVSPYPTPLRDDAADVSSDSDSDSEAGAPLRAPPAAAPGSGASASGGWQRLSVATTQADGSGGDTAAARRRLEAYLPAKVVAAFREAGIGRDLYQWQARGLRGPPRGLPRMLRNPSQRPGGPSDGCKRARVLHTMCSTCAAHRDMLHALARGPLRAADRARAHASCCMLAPRAAWTRGRRGGPSAARAAAGGRAERAGRAGWAQPGV